ncbi:MAG: phosphatase PAP2 family protein [bacterium]
MHSRRYLNRIILFLSISLFALQSVFPYANSDSTTHDLSKFAIISLDLSNAASRSISYTTSPLRASTTDWLEFSGVAGIIVASSLLDQTVHERVRSAGGDGFNGNVWDLPTLYGTLGTGASLSFGTYATGLLTSNDELRVTGAMMGESVLLAGATTWIVKYVAGRSRPFMNQGAGEFSVFQSSYNRQSFPSGHTTIAFALSTVLAERIDTPLARFSLYSLAALTGCARMVNNQHWFSDVLGGAAIGTAAALFVLHNSTGQKNSTPRNDTGIFIYPSLNGVSLVLKF